jgi:hypothetical protein
MSGLGVVIYHYYGIEGVYAGWITGGIIALVVIGVLFAYIKYQEWRMGR